MRGNMRRAETARPTDPQRDRFIIQPRNKLKEDHNQRLSGRCDPTKSHADFLNWLRKFTPATVE